MPPFKGPGQGDWFEVQQPSLIADGWIFYVAYTYDPTEFLLYSPTVLPQGVPNTAANRRKRNRPSHAVVARTTADPRDPWQGTLKMGTSTLNPWATGFAPPFTLVGGSIPEEAWATGPGSHIAADGSPATEIETEFQATKTAPAATFTKQYTGLWLMDPAFPDDWTKGSPNSLAVRDALRDMFLNITVPA